MICTFEKQLGNDTDGKPVFYREWFGLSSDTKPTTGNSEASSFFDYLSIPVVGDTLNNVAFNFTDASKVYATSATANYIAVQLYIDSDYNAGARAADIIPNVMVGEGSTAPSAYVPYGYKFPMLKAENCGCVDLGTLTWGCSSGWAYPAFYAAISDMYAPTTMAGTNIFELLTELNSSGEAEYRSRTV